MEGSSSSSNWAGLPPELLVSIADRLPFADYARFPAVCSSWASSIKDLLPKPPSSSHFPWLAFIPADPTGPLTFLNRPENHRRYQIHSSSAASASAADLSPFYLGHRDGWLAAVLRDSSVVLLNPLTSATSRLPSILTLQDDPFPECVDKIVLSASQDGEPPIAVVAYGHTLVDHLAFARPGDSEWTPLHAFHHYYDDVDDIVEVEDVVYHDGKFFAIFTGGHLLSVCLSGPSPVASLLATAGMGQEDDDADEIEVWNDCDVKGTFLVSAPSGDLLQVRKRSWSAREGKMSSFDVLRFDRELDGWAEVNGLGGAGDWSLFLDRKGSVVLSGMPGMDGNHIIFVDSSYSQNKNIFKVGVYDFGKGTAGTFFPEDISFDETTYQLLIWFRPSLL